MVATRFQQILATTISALNCKGMRNTSEPSTKAMFFMACACALLPLDISQLAFAILGAALCAMLQQHDTHAPKKVPALVKQPAGNSFFAHAPEPKAQKTYPVSSKPVSSKPVGQPEVRQSSILPIVAPVFASSGLEDEVQELLVQITPTPEVDRVVNRLAELMRSMMRITVPEVEVSGFASGNLNSGKAFGVAVPEVDIVATVSPQCLFNRLHGRTSSKSEQSSCDLDVKKLQKSAVRFFTDRLVAEAGFKFRRSAFRGEEPKVTLLAPVSLGLFAESIAIDFSVNVVTPIYNAALLTECGMMNPIAKELIFVVKRWAKDRGICHAAKGHLSPYLWGLLTMYFLQVGDREEGPLLPPFHHFEVSASLGAKSHKVGAAQPTDGSKWKQPAQAQETKKSLCTLFKQFVHFFHAEFDWCNEAVALCAARRAPSSMEMSGCSKASQIGPSIENPFDPNQNLGNCMNALSLARLKEELVRAEQLLVQEASLSELLEPWVPADNTEAAKADLDIEDALPVKALVKETKHKAAHAAIPNQKAQTEGAKRMDWRRDAAVAQGYASNTGTAALARTAPWRK